MHTPHPPLNVGPVPHPTAVVAPNNAGPYAHGLTPPLPNPTMMGAAQFMGPLAKAQAKANQTRADFMRALDLWDRALGELAAEHTKAGKQ